MVEFWLPSRSLSRCSVPQAVSRKVQTSKFFGKVYFGCIFWLFFSDRSSQLLAFVWLLRKCSKQELTLKTWDENTWISIFTWRNLLSNTILISVREGRICCTLSKSWHCQKGEGVPPMPRFVVKRFESYLGGFVVKGFWIFFRGVKQILVMPGFWKHTIHQALSNLVHKLKEQWDKFLASVWTWQSPIKAGRRYA